MALYKKDIRKAIREFKNEEDELRRSAGEEELQIKNAGINKKGSVSFKFGNLFVRVVRNKKKGGVKIIKRNDNSTI
mgnify:FL=1|jgi:hypothetical protein